MNARAESIWHKNFICAIIANFLLAMAHTSVNTLASTYAAFLGAEAVLVGALTSIFFGVSVAMRPVAGPLTTRVNNRTLMIVVYILGVLVHIGYTVFIGVGPFLVFRILNGIQYSIIGSLTMKTASDSLPASKAASGIGVYCISNSAANALGPSAGVIARDIGTRAAGELFGFRCVFIFAGIMMILALIPVFCLNDPGRPRKIEGSVWYKEMFSPHALAPALSLMLLMMSYSLFSAYMVPYAAQKGIPSISIFFLVHAMCLVGTRPLFGMLADKYGLDRDLLHIEVTESAISDDPARLEKIVRDLHDAGFVIELDDFGSGYSSIATLNELTLDVLKLDMSLVRKDDPAADNSALKFAVMMGKMLNLKLVAEGVETAEQVERLRGMGCDYIQGYYYSRPLPQADFEAYLAKE